MSKYFKKCLLISASALMILSVSAGAMSNPVSAHRHYRIHRVYRHRRAHVNLNTWYKRNAKALKRRNLYHNRMFTRGWKDSHYKWNNRSDARLNPRYNNSNYRHGWIIGRTYADNNNSFKRYQSYWTAIHQFNAGESYASIYGIHHDIYNYGGNTPGEWESSASKAFANNL